MIHANSHIVITGAAGFIASRLAAFLNKNNFKNLYLVDDFTIDTKKENFKSLQYLELIQRDNLHKWIEQYKHVDAVIHLGARTDTTEMNYEIHRELNLEYSKKIWTYCVAHNVPLVYASSAATYGNGEHGYDDNHKTLPQLKPLNPYGRSKHEFDVWALEQCELGNQPLHWYGLKFFNVYGPHEYHKGRMASVVWHAYNQIKNNGKLRLFKSHRQEFEHGGQLRDFIYVNDVIDIIFWLLQKTPSSGIYNVGTGNAATFNQLGRAVFQAMNVEENIEYIDTPIDIRDTYQYYTQANMQKLRQAGYNESFIQIENGVMDYIQQHLNQTSTQSPS